MSPSQTMIVFWECSVVIIVTWCILGMYALQEDNLEVDPEDNEDNEIIMRVLSS